MLFNYADLLENYSLFLNLVDRSLSSSGYILLSLTSLPLCWFFSQAPPGSPNKGSNTFGSGEPPRDPNDWKRYLKWLLVGVVALGLGFWAYQGFPGMDFSIPPEGPREVITQAVNNYLTPQRVFQIYMEEQGKFTTLGRAGNLAEHARKVFLESPGFFKQVIDEYLRLGYPPGLNDPDGLEKATKKVVEEFVKTWARQA